VTLPMIITHQRQLGDDVAALLGRPVVELVYPEGRESFTAVLSRAGETVSFEDRIPTASGTWAWVESALRETADADATRVLSSRLIGDRKVLEAECATRPATTRCVQGGE